MTDKNDPVIGNVTPVGGVDIAASVGRNVLRVDTEHLMQFFEFGHLPAKLQEVSRPFGELAQQLVLMLPRNPERTVALRKLLEAKDCAVRALIAK